MLPSELQSLLDQVDACEDRARALLAGLDEDALNQPPARGGWSVAQCLQHLALMNDCYLRGWDDAVREAASRGHPPFRGLRPTPFGRWFVRSLEPPVRMRGKAVAAASPPPRIPRAGLLDAYVASHGAYRHLVRRAAALDVNRVVRPNPILRAIRMRLSTVLLIVPAHDRRHLWQAANVARELGDRSGAGGASGG